MARIDKHALTRTEIIKVASKNFLENGYSNTTIKSLSRELDMSPGNITFYFPTKEHLLAELIDMLCGFQHKRMEEEADEGVSSVLAICLELATMVVMAEEDEITKEFYISAYSSPMCLEIIRRNDSIRAQKVFASYRPDWTKEQFSEAEILVSGIEFATLMNVGDPVTIEKRITAALNNILGIYGVPEDVRESKIKKVFQSNFHKNAKSVVKDFKNYVDRTNVKILEELINVKSRK